jgi:hypothetical protein
LLRFAFHAKHPLASLLLLYPTKPFWALWGSRCLRAGKIEQTALRSGPPIAIAVGEPSSALRCSSFSTQNCGFAWWVVWAGLWRKNGSKPLLCSSSPQSCALWGPRCLRAGKIEQTALRSGPPIAIAVGEPSSALRCSFFSTQSYGFVIASRSEAIQYSISEFATGLEPLAMTGKSDLISLISMNHDFSGRIPIRHFRLYIPHDGFEHVLIGFQGGEPGRKAFPAGRAYPVYLLCGAGFMGYPF